MTNEDRAARAAAAIQTYIEIVGDLPDESNARDLICDILHYINQDTERDFGVEACLEMAKGCYEEELENPDFDEEEDEDF